jgi:hypothetical protein
MAAMDDQAKQAFAAASDWAKKILTLSTGILTVTVTLSDTIFRDPSGLSRWLLLIAWALFIVSIFGGIWVLTALNDTLVLDKPLVAADVQSARKQAFLQVLSFMAGTVVLAVLGFVIAG